MQSKQKRKQRQLPLKMLSLLQISSVLHVIFWEPEIPGNTGAAIVIVQARSTKLCIVHVEAERLDEVQHRTCARTAATPHTSERPRPRETALTATSSPCMRPCCRGSPAPRR